MSRAARVSDVARLAGVSIGTVSNVLNNPGVVAEATRRRVHDAIAQLQYVPNANARSLASGSSDTIGLIVPDLHNTVFVDVARGAQDAAAEQGATLLIASSSSDLAVQDRYLDLFDENRVRGILLAPMSDSSEGIRRVRAHGRPVVLLNYRDTEADCCTVLVDNELDGQLAVEHLVARGIRDIVFLAGPERLQPIRDRRVGVRRAVLAAGVALEEIELGGIQPDEGRDAVRAGIDGWRRHGRRIGLVASTDLLALGAVRALWSARVSVPEEVAVVGCDGNRMAWESPVPFTTVETPGVAMGREAVRLLLAEPTGRAARGADGSDASDAESAHRHETVLIPPTLTPKESTRALD